MKIKKSFLITTYMLLICLFVSIMTPQVSAATAYAYSVNTSVNTPAVGTEFEISISLTDYDEAVESIRGLQIDITNIDTNIFEVVSHSTSIVDATAASNQTSYSASSKRIRLTYASVSGTLDKSTTEVMSIVLRAKDSITTSGEITLPVKVMIVSTDGNTTQNSTLTINYVVPTLSVDITWGAMEFTYTNGEWQPESHTYADGEWTLDNEGENVITVTNDGNVPVNVTFTYTKTVTEVEGSFVDSGGTAITSPFTLAVDEEKKVKLILNGKPSSTLEDATLGSVTITITLPKAQNP